MNRRAFLRFLGTSLAVAATASQLDMLANQFTEREAENLMLLPEVEARAICYKTFQQLLAEYFPAELLRQEIMKRDYVLAKIPQDDAWSGGYMEVPFEPKRKA